MKGNKVVLIIQEVLMYLAQLPYTLALIFMLFVPNENSELIGYFFIAGLIANLAIFPILILNAVFAFIGIFKGMKSPIKLTMVVKLSLIPWYSINFFLGFCFFTAALNPFLMWSIPLVVGIMVCTTYMYMVSSNFQVYSYIIHKLIRRKARINSLLVWCIVLSFIFCLDILSSILLFYNENKIFLGEGED